MTYKVLCGARGSPQIVHVDRLRLKRGQILAGEPSIDNDELIGEDVSTTLPAGSQATDSPEHDSDGGEGNNQGGRNIDETDGLTSLPQRIRRPPRWLTDYVTDFE